MPTSNPKTHHVYRLALYGVRSSGKTCILAGLSLPRVAHPDGLSCIWIENVPGHELPSGDPNTWKSDDPYHIGWQWLSEQRSRLKTGEIPEPNRNRETMRFLFDFGSPDVGTQHVELIDYSGELITASASELARSLREHMRECDGLLILAEAPHSTGNVTPLADDLEKLSGAFRELLNERDETPLQEWPIAILFNKWDRRKVLGIEGKDASTLLNEFLDQSPPPPHASLLNTVRNAVGRDNAQCFPVSAFGSHELRGDGAEVPLLADGRLQSFGLENGFVWAIQRRDSMQVEQLETAANGVSWWAFPQLLLGTRDSKAAKNQSAWKRWFCGASAMSGISSAWGLRQRFAKQNSLHHRVRATLRKFGLKFASQLVVFVALLLFLLHFGETTLDGMKYQSVVATRDNPAATVDQLKQGEAWLEQYFTSPSFRHRFSNLFTLSRSDAHRLLIDFRTRRDESLWQPVHVAGNFQTKVTLARVYVDQFPSGLHHSEANGLVAESIQREQERNNDAHLAQVALKVAAISLEPETSLSSLHDLSLAIEAIPHPEVRSETNTNRQKELRERIAIKQDQIAQAVSEAEWKKFEQTYLALIHSKNISEAAKLLDGRSSSKDAKLPKLVNDFQTRAPMILKEKVHVAIKSRSWQFARDSARIIADPNVVRLLPVESLKSLKSLGQEIDEAEDTDLYSQILRYKPQCADQVDAYLSRAPLKAMKNEVETYRAYITQIKGTLDLKLSLSSLAWHSRYIGNIYNYRNDVRVETKGKPLIVVSGLHSKPNTTSSNLGTGDLSVRLNDTITIDVAIVAQYGVVWDATMSGGKGNWTGTPDQLRSGITIPVMGDGFTNKATFTLDGIPAEPTLPVWKIK